MKTINTFLTLSILVLSTTSFAVADGIRSETKSNVPIAPSVWGNAEIEVPESLKFIKAKNARVPLADFVWGDPSEEPANLLMVPLAPFVYGDSYEDVPQELNFVKGKFATVPVAPFVWGNPSDVPAEISFK